MRTRWLATLLVLLLVAAPALAQVRHDEYLGAETDDDAAVAPIQVLVDASAQVVGSAIREAARDGTPDAAERQLKAMRTYVGVFASGTDWPQQATSPALHDDTFDFGQDLVTALSPVPAGIGQVSRITVGCDAWQANATQAERVAWGERTWPAFNELSVATATLNATLEEVPARVDATSLRAAIEQLNAWRVDRLEPATDCLPPPTFFYLRVHPEQSWPGARVLLQGGLGEPPREATVRLSSPSLGLSTNLTLEPSGGFTMRYQVPLEAPLAEHTVTATHGDRATTANLTLTKAPSRLVVRAPPDVAPGQSVDVEVVVLSPLQDQVGPGPVSLDGPLARELVLTDRRATFTVEAPGEPTVLNGTVRYAGSDLVQPATATYHIPVVPPSPTTEARTAPLPVLAPGGQVDFTDGIRIGPLFLTWTQAAVTAGLLLLALAGLWYLARQAAWHRAPLTREPTRFKPRPRNLTFQVLDPLAQSVVTLFASLVVWLRTRGLVPASWTAREIGEQLDAWGIPSKGIVAAFEEARYRPEGHPAGQREPAEGLLSRFWTRAKEVLR